MAYLTRRERERLKVIRVRKQREKRGKHPILNQTFVTNTDLLTSLSYKELRYFTEIWFIKYLLEKLKNLDIFKYYFYTNLKKNEISKSFKNLEDTDRLNKDIILYNLIWNKSFDYYTIPLNQTPFFKSFKRFKGSFENNPKIFQPLWSNIFSIKIPNENSINNFNFKNSLLIDFNLYLQPLNLKNKRKVQNDKEKDLTFYPKNWLELVLNSDSQDEESLQNIYEEYNELFIEEYEKSLLPPDFKELGPYFNYFNLPETKEVPNLLISKRKSLEEFYIENFIIEEINIKNNPYSYVNIEKLKIFLNNLKLTEKEKEFQVKLCLVHNVNLKFLKIPVTYVNFQENNIKKVIFDYSSFDIQKIKYIENSKTFTDINLYLLFINKTLLNFIEIFLLKFKNVLPVNKLFNSLFKSLTNKEEFAGFYNMLVKEFNLIKYDLTLYSIKFIVEFLEFLFDILRLIDNYDNILLFNIQKIKFLYEKFALFDLMYFKRFLMFEYNNETNWLNYLLEINSINCISNLNFYSMMISDYIIKYYQDIPEDVSLKTLILDDKKYKINIFKYYFRYQLVNNLLRFYAFKNTYRKMNTGKHIGFAIRDRNFVFLGHYLPFYNYLLSKCKEFMLNKFFISTNSLINLVRYKYIWTCKNLKKAMLRRSNMEFVLFNIDDLKLNPFVFAEQYYKLHQILTESILKTNNKDFDIWDLVNKKIELPGLTHSKRLLLFLAYVNLMVYICFNNSNLLADQKNVFKSFLSRFSVYLQQLKLRRQPNSKAPLLKQVYKGGKLVDLKKYKPIQRKPYKYISLDEILSDLKNSL